MTTPTHDPRKNHISYFGSTVVFGMTTVFCFAVLAALAAGWSALPPGFRSVWGEIVFACVCFCLVIGFASFPVMWWIKVHAMWKLDHEGIKEPRKVVPARRTTE